MSITTEKNRRPWEGGVPQELSSTLALSRLLTQGALLEWGRK